MKNQDSLKNTLVEGALTNFKEPINAYLLGFLWADGHLDKRGNSISMDLTELDFVQIEPYIRSVGINNIRSKQKKHNGENFGRPIRFFYLNSKVIADTFRSIGFSNKSRSFPNLKSVIPLKNHKYFWRGYFEGDGCLYINRANRVTFWGHSEQNWGELKDLLKKLKISGFYVKQHKQNRNKNHSASFLEMGRSQEVKIFLNYIYKDVKNGYLCLKRKRDKYLAFLKKYKTIRNRENTYSKVTGVSYNKNFKLWTSTIRKNKKNKLQKNKFLGYSKTEDEAIKKIKEYYEQGVAI